VALFLSAVALGLGVGGAIGIAATITKEPAVWHVSFLIFIVSLAFQRRHRQWQQQQRRNQRWGTGAWPWHRRRNWHCGDGNGINNNDGPAVFAVAS